MSGDCAHCKVCKVRIHPDGYCSFCLPKIDPLGTIRRKLDAGAEALADLNAIKDMQDSITALLDKRM